MFCALSYKFIFIGDKISANILKYEITPSLKANGRLRFAQNVALNRVREKGKPQWKISYKVLKEEEGYDKFLDISTYPTLIQLKYFLGRIYHCVTVIGKLILEVIFLLHFLSIKKIWTTVSLMTMKEK